MRLAGWPGGLLTAASRGRRRSCSRTPPPALPRSCASAWTSSFSPLYTALQRKGRGESNMNVWFPFMYSQKWNFYFQNRILMFCLAVPTLIYLWEIYIFPGSVCLFCCREIPGPVLGIYISLSDTWMWNLGLMPRNFQKRNRSNWFSLQCVWIQSGQ